MFQMLGLEMPSCLLFADFSIEIVLYLIIMESGSERVPYSSIVF